MNLHILYMGTNTDSMKNSPPKDRDKFYVSKIDIFYIFFLIFLLLKSTRHFVAVVIVKYVCEIMYLMLVTL